MAIIIHNIVIDVEGVVSGAYFSPIHTQLHEEEDSGVVDENEESEVESNEGEVKRDRLVAELLAFRYKCRVDSDFM